MQPQQSKPGRVCPQSDTSASRPMVIPSRPCRNKSTLHKKQQQQHAGVPPAVAALLAVTAIPPPASRKAKIHRRRKSIEIAAAAAAAAAAPSPPVSGPWSLHESINDSIDDSLAWDPLEISQNPSRAALSVLLSPPEDYEEDTTVSVRRSTSTDSVPSLEADDESTLSWSSGPSTPHFRRRPTADPRSRILSSPPEECLLDHPLIFDSDDNNNHDTPEVETEPVSSFFAEDTLKRVSRRLNFKSNLTASIRVLKSAARSFSAISVSATLVQPDDYLTRSILSITPQFTDERRPRPSDGVPTPYLRRYLNPTNLRSLDAPCTGAVQMQTWTASSPTSTSKNSAESNGSGDPYVAGSGAAGPVTRQREVRENGDFLRVIVLEMNMRREGKLSDTAQGKARLVLPPRQPCKYRPLGDARTWEAWVF